MQVYKQLQIKQISIGNKTDFNLNLFFPNINNITNSEIKKTKHNSEIKKTKISFGDKKKSNPNIVFLIELILNNIHGYS